MHDFKNVYRSLETRKDEIIQNARSAVGSARVPVATLKEAAFAAATTMAAAMLAPAVAHALDNAAIEFQMMTGNRPTTNETELNAWLDAFDAHMLAAFTPELQKAIGPGALGEMFSDCDLDDDKLRADAADTIALRLAEAARPLDNANTDMAKPSVNKTLSAVGIVETDLAPYALADGKAKADVEERVITEPEARGKVEAIVGAYALRIGGVAFDPLSFDALLNNAFDMDHFISVGALVELCGAEKEALSARPFFVAYMQAAPLSAKGDTMSAALAALANGKPVEPPKVTKPKPPKITPATTTAVAPPPPPPVGQPAVAQVGVPVAAAGAGKPASAIDGDATSAIVLWRDTMTKFNDQSLADACGVSRGTIGNAAAGKAKITLTAEQREKIKATLQQKTQAIAQIMAMLG